MRMGKYWCPRISFDGDEDGTLGCRNNEDGVTLENMDTARTHPIWRSLTWLLQARRGCGAQNPYDIVYAHLGMASIPDGKSEHLVIDYNKSICEVYVSIARYILEMLIPT